LGAPAYKIASFEIVDLPLIKYAASTQKPMIISTGMASAVEISEAVQAATDGGCKELVLLHCVSGYPAPAEEYNLQTILDMRRRFSVPVGLSDHTLNNITAITSIAYGACMIEKHFTLDRNGGGPDDSFSLDPHGLKELCESVGTSWAAIGQVAYGGKSSEEENIKFRRSLYFVEELRPGEVIREDSIRSVRPGFGMAPKFYSYVVGKRVKSKVCYGDPVLETNLI
jgi:N-acetylneuraminate synthase